MEYEIVMGCSVHDLATSVNGYIEMGWVPQGGVSSWNDFINGGVWYIQAIVRNPKQEEA